MEMTIDESISIFKNKGKYSLTEKENEAKRIAIDTMCKDQKIEKILNDCDLEAWKVLERIREVVEDGND